MSQSEVFQACLALYKQESTIVSDNTINKDWNDVEVTTMGMLCDNLTKVYEKSSIDDQLKVFPHVLSILYRSMQRCLHSKVLQIINIKCLISCIECSVCSIDCLLKHDGSDRMNSIVEVIVSQEPLSRIVLLIVALFEILKQLLQHSDSSSSLLADEEHLCLKCLSLFYLIIKVNTINSNNNHSNRDDNGNKLIMMLRGPLLAQIIQSILNFAQHKNKSIAQQSLACLLELFRFLKSDSLQSEWRNFFPGIYSGLYALCCSGYKSGSSILHASMNCLIEVTTLIANDSSNDNKILLQSLNQTTSTCSSASTSNTQAALHSLMSQISRSNNSFTSQLPQENTLIVPTNLRDKPNGFESVTQMQEWRVNVLQRVEVHFPNAFREVIKILTPKQKESLIESFTTLLCSCVQFLGVRCISEYIICFSSLLCDSASIVSNAARTNWQKIKQSLIAHHGEIFRQVISAMKEKFLTSLKLSSKYSLTGGYDVQLLYELKLLLGIGYIASNQLNMLMHSTYNETIEETSGNNAQQNNDVGVTGMIFQLCYPDLQSLRTILLHSRQYSNISRNGISSVESGYYRLQWRCSNDDTIKSMIRRVCTLLGKSGCFDEIISQTSNSIKNIQQVHKLNMFQAATGAYTTRQLSISNDAQATSASIDSSEENISIVRIRNAVSLAVAGLMVINFSMFGLLHQTATSANSYKCSKDEKQLKKCQYCNIVESNNIKMSKCSKCKATPVYYCCRDHQLKDWSAHKVICGQTTKTEESGTKNGDVSTLYGADDIVDSELLICNEQLSFYSSNCIIEGKNRFPLVKEQMEKVMKLCLNAIYQYLQLKITLSAGLGNNATDSTVEVTVYEKDNNKFHETFKYASELVKLYALVAASSVECIANCAIILGQEHFTPYIQECLYPLLELLVDSDMMVKQAAKCSLERISLYLQQKNLSELIRTNLDYIVDEACANLRLTSTSYNQKKKKQRLNRLHTKRMKQDAIVNPSTHLIVDLVMSIVGYYCNNEVSSDSSSTGNNQAPIYLMRDMVFDTLENIDTLANSTPYQLQVSSNNNIVSTKQKTQHLTAMLHVLQVFVHRTLAPPPLNLLSSNVIASSYFIKTVYGTDSVMNELTMQNSVHSNDSNNIEEVLTDDNVTSDDNVTMSTEDKIRYIANHRKNEGEASDDIQNDDDNNETTPIATPAQQLILDILQRCHYFISIPDVSCTLSIIHTISSALLRLSTCQRLLLPAIHQVFPSLMSRIKEIVQALYDSNSELFQITNRRTLASTNSSLLIESKTKYYNKPSESTSVGVTSNNNDKVSIINTSDNNVNSVERLHILPPMCEMFCLLSVIAGDFLTLKYREELFPQVILLLRYYHTLAVTNELNSNSNKSPGKNISAGGLKLSDLVITPNTNGASASEEEPSSQSGRVSASAYSKFSIHSKVKIALLNLLTQMCVLPVANRMLSDHVNSFNWFLLSFLLHPESHEVITLASTTIIELSRLPNSLTLNLTESILYTYKTSSQSLSGQTTLISYKDALDRWHNITHMREIVQYYETTNKRGATPKLLSVPRDDIILRMFHNDNVFMERINSIYKKLK